MKKLLLLVLAVLLFTVALSGCSTSEPDYYTKDEIDAMLEPTQLDRFIQAIFQAEFSDYLFGEVGDTFTGEVLDWDYGYIVIELEEETDVILVLDNVAPIGDWDINIYFEGNLMDYPDLYFEDVEDGDEFTLTLQPGFNIIEIDSYSDYAYSFSIIVNYDGDTSS